MVFHPNTHGYLGVRASEEYDYSSIDCRDSLGPYEHEKSLYEVFLFLYTWHSGLSRVRTSGRHGSGRVGRPRPPADVRWTACRPPLPLVVGLGGRNGRPPCRPPGGVAIRWRTAVADVRSDTPMSGWRPSDVILSKDVQSDNPDDIEGSKGIANKRKLWDPICWNSIQFAKIPSNLL
jgi:hypothetical protein